MPNSTNTSPARGLISTTYFGAQGPQCRKPARQGSGGRRGVDSVLAAVVRSVAEPVTAFRPATRDACTPAGQDPQRCFSSLTPRSRATSLQVKANNPDFASALTRPRLILR